MALVVVAALASAPPAQAAAATCTEDTRALEEDFSGTSYYDSEKSRADGWGSGQIYAPPRTGGFPNEPNTVGVYTFDEKVRAIARGTFSSLPTLIAQTVYLTDSGSCRLMLRKYSDIQNVMTAPGKAMQSLELFSDDVTCGDGAALIYLQSPPNRDNVVAIVPNHVNYEGTVKKATLYRSETSGGLSITVHDFTALAQQAGLSFHGGTPIAAIDVDGDGRQDLLAASSTGSVNQLLVFYSDDAAVDDWELRDVSVLIPNLGFVGPFADATRNAKGGPACASETSMVSRGATGLTVIDWNQDGLNDIAVVSASEPNIHMFFGKSRTAFERGPDIVTPGATGITYIDGGDFNGDGLMDIVYWNDGKNCRGKPAYAQILFQDDAGGFVSSSPILHADNGHIDWAIRQWGFFPHPPFLGHIYARQRLDSFVLGNHSPEGSAVWWFNTPNLNYFSPAAQVQSKVFDAAKSGEGNLGSTQLITLNRDLPSGASLRFLVTANNGANWEPLTSAEAAGKSPHVFQYLGKSFKWQAELHNPNRVLTGKDASFSPASTDTASIKDIVFKNTWLSDRTFSRSQPAYGSVYVGGKMTEYVYASSFTVSSFSGHITAQPLTTQALARADALETIVTSATWDAADTVSRKAEAARTIFTAAPKAAQTNVADNTSVAQLNNLSFDTSSLQSTTMQPTLVQRLALPSSRATPALSALRAGVATSGRPTLRETGHGSPVFVGPPDQNPNVMGNQYAAFVSAKRSRRPLLLQGANDGMLHGFDAATGEELWAMVPTNLLDKLTLELQNKTGTDYGFQHVPLVDGPIGIGDVYNSAQGWRTIAVVGQGDGTAIDGRNFYFAVDITDPAAPKWLWQMSQAPSQGGASCNPDPCAQQRCDYTCTTDKNACKTLNVAYDAQMLLRSTQLDGGSAYGLLEAEHLDTEVQGMSPSAVDWVSVQDGSAKANAARGKTYIEVSPASATCSATNLRAAQDCAQVSYNLHADAAFGGNVYPLFRVYQGGGTVISYSVDQTSFWRGSLTKVGTPTNGWQWMVGAPVSLSAGPHTLTVYHADANVAIDAVALSLRAVAPTALAKETPGTRCKENCVSNGCTAACLTSPATQEWPTCGLGKRLRCCNLGGGQGYCGPMGKACATSSASMGRALSTPSIGRIRTSAGERWVAFFGSGDRSDTNAFNQGMSLYLLDAYNGTPMASWSVPSLAPPAADPFRVAAIQAGPTLVDADGDGNVDRVYFGDLGGRLHKLNTSAVLNVSGAGQASNANQYVRCLMFDAGDPEQTGTRQYNPIFQAPAVSVHASGTVNVYFGTGILPSAPSSRPSAFYSLLDADAAGGCNPVVRKASSLRAADGEWQVTEPSAAKRNFTAGTLVGDSVIYFSSYDADSDSTSVCPAPQAASRVYGRATRNFVSTKGRQQVGASVLAGGVSSLAASGTIRSAPILRGGAFSSVARANASPFVATDLLMQQSTGETLRLTTPEPAPGRTRLRKTRFRTIQPQ